MLQAAQHQGIQVSADQINATLSSVAKQHGLTLAQLPKALAAQGRNYLAYRRRVKDQMLVHQLVQQAVASKVAVSPAEIDDYLKREANTAGGNIEYQLAQILVAFPGDAGPGDVKQAKKKARALERRLEAGANFASLAAANSAGPHALEGGMIGWIKGANLPTLLEDVVPKMQAGSLSEPIAGPGGFHIVKLVATRKPEGDTGTEYHVRHILLKPNPVRDSEQSRALARNLRQKIASGKTSLATAAKTYSDDPNSAGGGGDIGWKSPRELPPAFSAIESLAANQISQPVKSHYGWDLMEVLGKRKGNASKEARRNDAYQAIFERKLDSQLDQFKRVIRGQAYVRILDPADADTQGTSTGAAAAFPGG
jgi:peptidyl-prolyl cis-trans isomerase SurA